MIKINPMLAQSSKPFDSDSWIYENKLDGVRCIAFLDGKVKLQARSGLDITHKFPELVDINKQANKPCILDGEIACQNFNAIQHRIHKEKPLDIKFAMKQYPATYYVFDILDIDGTNTMPLPLGERKEQLNKSFAYGKYARPIAYYSGNGIALFEKVKACGGEGIMAKNVYSTYIEGKRSNNWLKIKTFTEGLFYICGLTRGENDRDRTFGAVILGKPDNGEFNYMGCAGSGLTDEMLLHILRQIKPGVCPFGITPKLDKELLTWAKPEMLCEIRYLGYGSEGHLRFPTFRRLSLRGREQNITSRKYDMVADEA